MRQGIARIAAAEVTEAAMIALAKLGRSLGMPDLAVYADEVRHVAVRYQAGEIDGTELQTEARRIGAAAMAAARKDGAP